MHIFTQILGLSIPSYGLSISVGLIIANLLAFFVIRKNGLVFDDLIILEAYGLLGGFIGAKILYLLVSFREIAWNRLLEWHYINQVMRGGFVFYGGLIGALIAVFLAAKLHRLSAGAYLKECAFLIPLVHAFGRIGCFLAGCCYGVVYHGVCAVIFPENSLAPAGIPLFPVQLVEALCLLLISVVLYIAARRNCAYTIPLYLLLYGISRFLIEFARDDQRGQWLFLSTSQWISLLLIFVSVIYFLFRKTETRRKEKLPS